MLIGGFSGVLVQGFCWGGEGMGGWINTHVRFLFEALDGDS